MQTGLLRLQVSKTRSISIRGIRERIGGDYIRAKCGFLCDPTTTCEERLDVAGSSRVTNKEMHLDFVFHVVDQLLIGMESIFSFLSLSLVYTVNRFVLS